MPTKSPSVITEEQKWWRSPKRLEVFRLLINGNSVRNIAELTDKQLQSVQQVVSHPFFLRRLEKYLSKVLFNFQVNKVLAVDEVFKIYWDVVTGKKTVEGLDADSASKHLIKILSFKDSVQIINPRQYNLIMNILKTDFSANKVQKIAKEFGFENLKIPDDEGPQANPQLDTGAENTDEQGSAD